MKTTIATLILLLLISMMAMLEFEQRHQRDLHTIQKVNQKVESAQSKLKYLSCRLNDTPGKITAAEVCHEQN